MILLHDWGSTADGASLHPSDGANGLNSGNDWTLAHPSGGHTASLSCQSVAKILHVLTLFFTDLTKLAPARMR